MEFTPIPAEVTYDAIPLYIGVYIDVDPFVFTTLIFQNMSVHIYRSVSIFHNSMWRHDRCFLKMATVVLFVHPDKISARLALRIAYIHVASSPYHTIQWRQNRASSPYTIRYISIISIGWSSKKTPPLTCSSYYAMYWFLRHYLGFYDELLLGFSLMSTLISGSAEEDSFRFNTNMTEYNNVFINLVLN